MRQEWTTSEQRWLTQLAPTHTVMELAEKFDRSKYSINSKLNEMSLVAKSQNHAWTQREHRVVRDMMKDFSYEDIAKELGRPSASVRAYVRRNFTPKVRRTIWNPTREQIDRVAQLRKERVKLSVISSVMHCSIANLKWVVRRENIKRGIGYVHPAPAHSVTCCTTV